MVKNVGTTDRVVRTILGLFLLYFAYASLAGFWAFLGYAFGAVLLVTAATGYCPLYKAMGKGTMKHSM